MKKLSTIIVFTFFAIQLHAQYSNAIFFSENGERFHVILNGVNYSENAETNVKIPGLNAQPYNVRIIFADTSQGVIIDKIYMDYGKEKTYTVKLRKIGETEKSLKKIRQNLLTTQKQETTEANIDDINKTNEKYVLRTLSVTDISTPAPVQSNTQQQKTNQASSGKANVSGSQHSTSTTTTVTTAPAPQPNANANVSLNVNVGAATSYSQTTTSTVTTSGSESATGTDVYVMPGYNGPVGCPWPMSQQDFQSAKNSISSKSFEDSKLTLAKQIMNTNCLFSSQVKEIMLLFSFEDTRLDLAKYGYGYTFDIGNYYKVNDAFTFESSIDELNQYINNR